MKVLFLVTRTENCEPFWRSLEAIGHKVTVERYDDRPHYRHWELVSSAQAARPDFIAVIGAYEPSHGGPVPTIETFHQLKRVAPLVFLCGDAADYPWWLVLESYRQADCFSVAVSIDGTPIPMWPGSLTLLTPLDPRPFKPLPWKDRTIRCGMIGGLGHRTIMINDLVGRNLLHFNSGPVGRSYADFAALMCRTKITLNLGQTGTGGAMHVKGRVVEAGFAGCVLLEPANSPTRNWFTPGEDYLEYSSVDDAAHLIQNTPETTLERIAGNFRTKMEAQHHPEFFWAKVLSAL